MWLKIIALLLLLNLIGCSTVAYRENGETLKIKGTGSAKWPDGAEITGEPMFKLPTIPINYEGK